MLPCLSWALQHRLCSPACDFSAQCDAPCRSKLLQFGFWRVMLDEAQLVAASSSAAAVMCSSLWRRHAWVVSGTPVNRGKAEEVQVSCCLSYEAARLLGAVGTCWQSQCLCRQQACCPAGETYGRVPGPVAERGARCWPHCLLNMGSKLLCTSS